MVFVLFLVRKHKRNHERDGVCIPDTNSVDFHKL